MILAKYRSSSNETKVNNNRIKKIKILYYLLNVYVMEYLK